MKRVFKKNQIIITTLAIMIAIAGYLNFSGSKWTLGTEDLVETGIQSTEEDAQEDTALLDLSEEDLYTSNDIFTDEEPEDVSESVPGEAVLTSTGTGAGITAQAKVNREQVRSKNKEVLLEIINNVNIADDQKQDAIDAMIHLTDISEREAAAEMLLEAKGFTDVVVNITDDTADVVVNMADIGDAERAQIEDIMKRKTGVPAENIVITSAE
ncbi:MAG: SpoIIIAH-like family protein [Lachnospiraceae bacterium]|nr:SpoIIIAH-like family protein [Lachnospiraceae bacterium]MDD7023473.1 SpoIIIAH-like family protein [Oscillospiraceae bacterium]MDY5647360.1 SpoIIIAH-like family protein [Lachnospiraceae bacterium]